MTIEEIIAEIRYNQDYIRRSEEHIASRKVILKEFEDTLLSLGVQLVPPAPQGVGEPMTIGELKSGHPEPLTIQELKSETWYLHSCTGEDFAAFIHNEVPVYVMSPWDKGPDGHTGCVFSEDEVVRVNNSYGNRKEIRRMGNKFYWESDLK